MQFSVLTMKFVRIFGILLWVVQLYRFVWHNDEYIGVLHIEIANVFQNYNTFHDRLKTLEVPTNNSINFLDTKISLTDNAVVRLVGSEKNQDSRIRELSFLCPSH